MHRTPSTVKLFCAGIKGNFREPFARTKKDVIAVHKCARDLPYAILLEKKGGIVLREFFFCVQCRHTAEHNSKSSTMDTPHSCLPQNKVTMQTAKIGK